MSIQNLVNHVSMVVDASASMSGHATSVVKVFDREIDYLRKRSVDLDQETRLSVYIFGETVDNLVFDMDVMRMKSLAGYYDANQGSTALIDAAIKSLSDLREIPIRYGDHAFLNYILTDGEENSSRSRPADLAKALNAAESQGNVTNAVMVPNQRGVFEAKKFGFGAGNISIWDTSAHNAVEKVGTQFRSAIDNYMDLRSKGIRSTKSLYYVPDVADLSTSQVRSAHAALAKAAYQFYNVTPRFDGAQIRDFVENQTGKPYRLGRAYYELTKPEKVQASKDFLLQDRSTDEVYQAPRTLLGVPAGQDLKLKAEDFGKWRVFVQSTSVNRKLVSGTRVVVLK